MMTAPWITGGVPGFLTGWVRLRTSFGLQLRKDFRLKGLSRLTLSRGRCQTNFNVLVSIIAFSGRFMMLDGIMP